jgi:hypothetical protein
MVAGEQRSERGIAGCPGIVSPVRRMAAPRVSIAFERE